MTELQNIHSAAKAAFEETNYQLAFQILWEAGVSDFIRFGEKQEVKAAKITYNWFTFPNSAEYFWKKFVLTDSVFEKIFISDFSEQMLHYYYTKVAFCCQDFESKLANVFPKQFINSVRLSQSYLKSDRIDHLSSLRVADDLNIHQKVWRKIYDTDRIIWRTIQDKLIEVSQLPISDILSHCIIWLETNRFNNGNKEKIHHLAAVYSFYIELMMSKYPEKGEDILTSETFFEQFCEAISTLRKKDISIEETQIGKILSEISLWLTYKETVISPYSFDLNIQPRQENELLLFNLTPESLYNWRLNGVRYEVNQLHYLLHGSQIVEQLEINNPKYIPGKTKQEIESNRKLAELKWSTLLLLKEMGIESFRFNQTETEVEALLSPLLAYSYNRMNRYEMSLTKYSQNSSNWLEAFVKLNLEALRTDIRREPFLLMSKDEFKVLNKAAIEQLSDTSAEQVTQIASYEVKGKFEFNRFSHHYDVFQKPLLIICGNLFCPMIFFASNIWFYTFAQEALTRIKSPKTERDETKLMETYFGERLREKGWKVKVLNDNEASQLKGDVDIFVEDKESLLFIQLKRTYFRLTLKDAYYESINTDKKASLQLNLAEKFLQQENPIYTVTMNPVKWIVSTSCENIGAFIHGCKKVNYFEVLNSLNNPEIKSINELMIDIERDRNLKKMAQTILNNKISDEAKLLISETGLPLRMFDIKEYRQVIFSDDERYTLNYNEIFNQASSHYRAEKHNEALILFQKCVSLYPMDAEAIGALANTLANMRLFKYAFPEFEKALALAPNDPLISRDFSLALMESGKFYDGLSLALKLFEKFPLLADIRILFEGHFQRCLQQRLLSKDQKVELQDKWNSLN